MATTLQFRRGTALEAASLIGAEGEIFFDTQNKIMYVHDGITPGGKETGATYTEVTEALIDAGTSDVLHTITGRRAKYIQSVVPQYIRDTAYTLVLSDAGKHIIKNGTTARIWTIPANTSVAFPIGTAITFVNNNATANATIAITTNTLRLAGAGTTGSRILSPWGVATALKVSATVWIISGTGLA